MSSGMGYMSICPKCGNFKMGTICNYCNVETIKTPTEFDETFKLSSKQMRELEQYYIETLIKDTYDPKAREYREANEVDVWAGYVPTTSITCPNCSSGNVQKIGTGERAASVALFGLFSKKINKSYKCRSCGYTW